MRASVLSRILVVSAVISMVGASLLNCSNAGAVREPVMINCGAKAWSAS